MISLKDATSEDLEGIVQALSAADSSYIADQFGVDNCLPLLQEALRRSECACILLDDDRPLLIFGVQRSSLVTRDGDLWLIGTRHISQARISFARATRRILANLLKQYDCLVCSFNTADEREAGAVRWAKWLGATFSPMGTAGIEVARMHACNSIREAACG